MESADAFRTLRLDPSADGSMVQQAYWMLVRQAQERGARDTDARAEIDRLNEAYATLRPGEKQYAPPPPRSADAATGTEFIDRAVDWLSQEAMRTRVRWADRNLEIALIGGAGLFLAIVALAAGTSFWLVIVSIALMFGAIWAPWRRVHLPEADDEDDR